MGSGAALTIGVGWKLGCCCWYCWGVKERGGAPPSPGSDDGWLYSCPYCCGTCGYCCDGADAGGAAAETRGLDAAAVGTPPDAAEKSVKV